MRVEQLMSRPVHCCRPEDTLACAAQLMWDHDCGCVPVVAADGTGLAGIITDRDICMCAYFQNKPLNELRVSDAMAKQVQVCRASDSIAAAEDIMRKARVRRLPVVNQEDTLVGVISLADLAEEAGRTRTSSTPELTETEVGEVLAAVCEPVHRQVAA